MVNAVRLPPRMRQTHGTLRETNVSTSFVAGLLIGGVGGCLVAIALQSLIDAAWRAECPECKRRKPT